MGRSKRDAKDPHTTDPRDPLELIARLLVGGSYRVPVEGRSTAGRLGSSDIAAAVGYMSDPLEQRTVLAVATRADRHEVARVAALAYRAVVRNVRHLRPQPIDLSNGADRWRLRLAIYDAATELVWPERRQPWRVLAKAAKMRQASYVAIHRCASATLQQALNDGRREFTRRLWSGG